MNTKVLFFVLVTKFCLQQCRRDANDKRVKLQNQFAKPTRLTGEIFRCGAVRGAFKCLLVSNVVDFQWADKSKLVLKVDVHFFNGVCT